MYKSELTRLLEAAAKESENNERSSSNNNGEKTLTVETVDNHIYFYADVDSDRVLALIRAVREVDNDLRNERISRDIPEDHPPTPIWLHVHSSGGDVFAGLSAADQLATIQTPVFSVVEGMCASAATLISMACQRRYIRPSGFMLIHQISSLVWGTYEEFKDEMYLLEMLMDTLSGFYTGRTNLDDEQIREMLKRDTWMNAAKALEDGFVDEIRQGTPR